MTLNRLMVSTVHYAILTHDQINLLRCAIFVRVSKSGLKIVQQKARFQHFTVHPNIIEEHAVLIYVLETWFCLTIYTVLLFPSKITTPYIVVLYIPILLFGFCWYKSWILAFGYILVTKLTFICWIWEHLRSENILVPDFGISTDTHWCPSYRFIWWLTKFQFPDMFLFAFIYWRIVLLFLLCFSFKVLLFIL